MRTGIPLREIKIENLWQEIQELRTKIETHNHLTFGSQGLTGTVRGILQSPNFVTGSSGWRLSPDGSFEGNTGTFRGDLSGNSISGATITGGTIQTSASGARIIISGSANSLTQYDASNNIIALLDESGWTLVMYAVNALGFSVTNDSGVAMTTYLGQFILANAGSSHAALYVTSAGTAASLLLGPSPAAGHLRMSPMGGDPSAGTAGDIAFVGTNLKWCSDSSPTWNTVMANPMTAVDDIIYGGASGVPTALGTGSATNQELTLDNGGNLGWQPRVLTFIHLTDTPATYSGQGGKVVKVNSGATALEFGAPPGVTFADAQVFNGTIAGVGWTDLDLSGTVGSNRAMVYLRIKKTAAGAGTYYFREDDEAQDNVIFETITNQNDIIYVWMLTDASGVIEWKNPEQKATEIRVRCYLT